MTGLLHHRFAADLSVRSGGDGRTVMGIACPFDSPTDIWEWGVNYTESFQRGAFARTIAERADKVKFLAVHDRQSFPLGRAELLREDAAGLYGEFRVSKTARGDEALELIRDGALDSFSVGFTPIRSTPMEPRNGDHVVRQEVKLSEVSAVPFPAYEKAVMTGVRSARVMQDTIMLLERLREENPDGLDLERLDTYLGWAVLLREGKTLSSSTMTQLQGVLDLIAAADRAVDEAQPKLANLMGVPNPDEDDDMPDGDSDMDDDESGDAGRDDAAETATREAALDYDLAVLIARRHRVAV